MSDIHTFYRRYWSGERGVPGEHDPLIEVKWQELAKYVRPGYRVLDYGCGGGIFSERLVKAGCEVVGMDIAEEAIALARARVPAGAFLKVRLGEPLPAGNFDLVWVSEVLEHVHDVQFLLQELARATKAGGQLVVTVPYHGFLKNLAIALFRFEKHFKPAGAHIRFYTRKSLERLAREMGFCPRGFRGLGRLPYFWKSMLLHFQRS